MTGVPALLSLAELKALRPVTPRAGGYVTLWGRRVPAGPLSVEIYKRVILARFEAPRAFFVLGSQVAVASQAAEEAEAAGVEPDISSLQVVDGKSYTEAQVSDGGAANMAFIAAGIGAPGDADIERQLLDASDEELEAALTEIEFWTWGDDPARFFGRVGQGMAGRTLTVLQRASQAQASEPSRKKPTRTAGTTNVRNRKTRRKSASRKATSA